MGIYNRHYDMGQGLSQELPQNGNFHGETIRVVSMDVMGFDSLFRSGDLDDTKIGDAPSIEKEAVI